MYYYRPIGVNSAKIMADEEREEGENEKKENFDTILPGRIKTYTENIVVVGAEVHDKLPVNKLMFMAQAIRTVKLESVQTVLYFKQGYSNTMIAEFKKSLKYFKPNIAIIEITTVKELINYLNSGGITGKSNLRMKPYKNSLFKVKNVYIFSHGMPSRITFLLDWDLYKTNNKIISSVKAEDNELNLKNYKTINPNAFVREGYVWSFACRTGIGPEDTSDIEIFTWNKDASLAQKLANSLNVHTVAFLRRSNYEDTWGSRFDRAGLKIKKYFEIADDDDFKKYKDSDKMIDNKYHWNPLGAFNGVKAGSTPKGPPEGMTIFSKKEDN